MVHSYINSKMTITSLPGPYQDALRQPKSFTLQINLANNQEVFSYFNSSKDHHRLGCIFEELSHRRKP